MNLFGLILNYKRIKKIRFISRVDVANDVLWTKKASTCGSIRARHVALSMWVRTRVRVCACVRVCVRVRACVHVSD